MQKKIRKQIADFIKDKKKRNRMYALLAVLSVVVVTSVYAVLCMPAISMAKSQPLLEAERVSAVFGDALSFRVTAEAPEGEKQSVFALHTMSNGGGLSDRYEFDGQDICRLETEDGSSLELHRERDAGGETNYWFALDAGTATAFLLHCDNDSWVAPDEEAEQPEQLPETPEIPEEGKPTEPITPTEPTTPTTPTEPITPTEPTEPTEPTTPTPPTEPTTPTEPTEPPAEPTEPTPPAEPTTPTEPTPPTTPTEPDEGKNTEPEKPDNSEAEKEQKPETGTPETVTPPASAPQGLLASVFLPAYALDEENANEVLGGGEAETPSHEETPATGGIGDGAEQPAQLPETTPPDDEDPTETPRDSFLAESGENQFLTVSGGSGDSYKSALRAAKWNDAAVELTWKEELEERTLTVKTESGVEITVSGREDSFPGGMDTLTLAAEELTPLDFFGQQGEAEPDPIAAAFRAMEQATREDGFAAAEQRLFDIRLMRDGEAVEPLGQVRVSFNGLIGAEAQMDAQVYHVADTDGAASATEMESRVRLDGSVVMETDHFSMYGIVFAAAAPKTMTLEEIADGFGMTGQFAVFAKTMDARGSEIEGSIAVQNLTITNNTVKFGNTANTGGHYGNPSMVSLQITKAVEGTPTDSEQVYEFEICKAADGKKVKEASITGAGSTTVALPAGTYRVYELQDGKRLPEGEGSGFQVSYDAFNQAGLIASLSNSSYVEYFDETGANIFKFEAGQPNATLYVGEEYTINGTQITSPSGATFTAQNAQKATITKPTNIDWEAELNRLDALSEDMAACAPNYDPKTLPTAAGVHVWNIDAQKDGQISLDTEITNRGISLNDNQYLIINVDCSAVTDNTVYLPKLGINGPDPKWQEIDSHLIWNIVQGGKCFTGTVTHQGVDVGGIVLIPRGTMHQNHNFHGAILAETVIKDNGEIHQIGFCLGRPVRTTVTNTYPEKQGLALVLNKKNTAGAALDGAAFALYASNDKWEKGEQAGDSQTTKNGKAVFSNLTAGKYLLFETQAPTGYMKPAKPWHVTVTENQITLSYDGVQQAAAETADVTAETAADTSFAFTIINQKTDGKISVTVNKTWEGDGDAAARPTEIQVWLTKNGVKAEPAITLTATDGWSHTWKGLPVADENGNEIAYSVEEQEVDGYTGTVSSEWRESTAEAGWLPAESFSNGETYLIGYAGGDVLKNAKNSQLTAVKTDFKTKTDTAAQWTATARVNGFTLQNANTKRFLNFGYYSSYNQWRIGVSNSSSGFKFSNKRLIALYQNNNYYAYNKPTNNTLAAYSQDYNTEFALYTWQEGGTTQNLEITLTNARTAVPLPPDTPRLEHRKTIDALRDGDPNGDTSLDNDGADLTDLYRLYLDITGKQEPTDLLLIIDRSASMHDKYVRQNNQSVTRSKAVVNILTGENGQPNLINEFLGLNEENKVAVTWFAGDAKRKDDYWLYNSCPLAAVKDAGVAVDWTNQEETIKLTNGIGDTAGEIGGREDNGTNYAAGLWQAMDTLKQVAGDGHEKVVIFLSDGLPTYYVGTWGFGEGGYTTGDLQYSKLPPAATYQNYLDRENAPLYRIGNGAEGQTINETLQASVKSIATDFVSTLTNTEGLKNTQLYSMAFQTDATEVLKTLSPASKGVPYSVNSGDELSETLKEILYPVDVVITDHLSQYVQWYGDLPDVKVTMTETGTGRPTTLWQGNNQNGEAIGEEVAANNRATRDGKVIPIVDKVTYSPASGDAKTTGAVQVQFNAAYTLDPNYTYTLSFNVETTEQAYDDFEKAEYSGMKGDPETDYAGNKTSSDCPGFRSNNDADVAYTIRSNRYTEGYDHPVVQVASGGLLIRKTALDGETPLAGAKFDLYRPADTEDAVEIPGTGGVRGLKAQADLETDANGEIQIDDLAPGTLYLVETRAPTGYQLLERPIRFSLNRDKVTVLADGAEQGMAEALPPAEEGGFPILTVKNTNGYDLPATGGPGAGRFGGLGLLLMAGAALTLILRRRRERGVG